MKLGYTRISTNEQTTALQRDALAAGCEINLLRCPPAAAHPGLQEALTCVRMGDTLIVWQLDRLGRNLQELVVQITVL